MKKLYLLIAFIISSMALFSQSAEDDGYVIGFAPSDSAYMDFKVERTGFGAVLPNAHKAPSLIALESSSSVSISSSVPCPLTIF